MKRTMVVLAAAFLSILFASSANAWTIDRVTPNAGQFGQSITISGSGFGAVQGIRLPILNVFDSYIPLKVESWSATSVVARLWSLDDEDVGEELTPEQLEILARFGCERADGTIEIVQRGHETVAYGNSKEFHVINYAGGANAISLFVIPNEIMAGDMFDIYGCRYGETQEDYVVRITPECSGCGDVEVESWFTTHIRAKMPVNMPRGEHRLVITRPEGRGWSESNYLDLNVLLRITSVPPTMSVPRKPTTVEVAAPPQTYQTPQRPSRTDIESAAPTPTYEFQKPPPKLEAAPAQREYKTPMTTGSDSGKDKDKDKTDSSNTLGTSPSSSGSSDKKPK